MKSEKEKILSIYDKHCNQIGATQEWNEKNMNTDPEQVRRNLETISMFLNSCARRSLFE